MFEFDLDLSDPNYERQIGWFVPANDATAVLANPQAAAVNASLFWSIFAAGVILIFQSEIRRAFK